MLILTERTPNPDALKFVVKLPGVAAPAALEREQAAGSPLGKRLFALQGVSRCFVTESFVTVQRDRQGPGWDLLKYEVLATLAEHLASGEPALAPTEAPPESDDELIAEIQAVLRAHVRPGVAKDGGDVELRRFDPADGVLWVKMVGACGGCPSARLTLKASVEQIVRRYVPEVTRVEEEASEASAESGVAESMRRWLGEFGERPTRPRTLFTRKGGRSEN